MRQKSSKEQLQRELGAAIKRYRIARGMSRRDLQDATGRSYPYLSEIEAGKKAASTEVLGEIAAALGIEMHELIETAQRGFESRSWVAPRESHFHRSMDSMPRPQPSLGAFDLMDSSPSGEEEDPILELLRLAQGLSEEDLAMLVDLARRLAG